MEQCYKHAYKNGRTDARETASKGEKAERRARDARLAGERIAEDRRKYLSKSQEERAAMDALPYLLAPNAAAAAERVNAYQRESGSAPTPLPRTYGALAGAQDPSIAWKKLSASEAESAMKFFEEAAGGVDAARSFNQLAQETRNRGESMSSVGRSAVRRAGSGGNQSRSAMPSSTARAAAAETAGHSSSAGARAEVGTASARPAPLPAEKKIVSPEAGAEFTWSQGEKAPTPTAGLEALFEVAKKQGETGKARTESNEGIRIPDANSLFEQAMDRADSTSLTRLNVKPIGEVQGADAEARYSDDATVFARVSRQYRKREPVLISAFPL